MVRAYPYTLAAVNAPLVDDGRLAVADTNSLSRTTFDTVDAAFTLFTV